MGFKVIVFLSIFMVLLVSSQVGAARLLAHSTSNTIHAYSAETTKKPRGLNPKTPFCNEKVYSNCIKAPKSYKPRPCKYKTECRRPPHAQP